MCCVHICYPFLLESREDTRWSIDTALRPGDSFGNLRDDCDPGQPLSELPNPASVGENVEQAIYRA